MSERGVEAIVVAYGYHDDLAACLRQLSTLLPVTVVDNSSDAQIAALAEESGARYVNAGKNLGFAAGVNLGIQTLDPAVDVLLVNPDAFVTDQVVTALEGARGPKVAAIAPLLKGTDGLDQRVLWPFPNPVRACRQALLGGDGGRATSGFLVGAVLLLTRPALDEIGLFDEHFFLYAEETDWQVRAHRRGWSLVLCDEVTAVHVGGGTSTDATRRTALFHAGTETYIRKWYGASGWQIFRAATIIGALLRAILRPSDRKMSIARARLYLAGPRRMAGLI